MSPAAEPPLHGRGAAYFLQDSAARVVVAGDEQRRSSSRYGRAAGAASSYDAEAWDAPRPLPEPERIMTRA